MKNKAIILTATLASLLLGLAACSEKHDHSGDDHSGDGHGDHPHAEGDHHEGHEDGHGHEHATKTAGPNGGRLIQSVEPHIEFVILENRHVRITFLDDDLKPLAVSDQLVSLTGGDRSDPFNLAFAKDGTGLLSDKAIPAGDDHPGVLSLKANADANTTFEKFHLNLHDCPTCDYKEYACICGHGDHDDHGHEEKEMK